METAKVPFNIRAATIADISLVFNSLLKSHRDSASVKSVPNSIYYAEHHKTIEKILSSPGLVLLVACGQEDSDQVFGYVLAERFPDKHVVHFIYVKYSFRKFGIAKALLAAANATNISDLPIMYSHQPKNGETLLKKIPSYVFNPYLLVR